MKKHLIIASALLLTIESEAQLSAGMQAGYSTKTVDVFLTPSLNYTIAHTVTLSTEMMVNLKRDAPVNFLIKGSYQYKFIEAGLETGPSVYSLDQYDRDKNGWINGVFAALHYKQYFAEWELLNNENKLSIGVRTPF